MNFIKRHYEKIVLGLVLLGLTGALAFLPFKISTERAELEARRISITDRKSAALTNLDLTPFEQGLARAQSGVRLDFSGVHNLANPVPWQKVGDRLQRLQSDSGGPRAVVPTKITPLFMNLSFESAGANGSNWLVRVQKETETRSSKQPAPKYLKIGDKIEVFALREVKGPVESPIELIFDVTDTGERASVKPNAPYRRVDGFMADLKYDPEKRTWSNQRVGSMIAFGGEQYRVAAITRNVVATNQFEVVISAKTTDKKTTIAFQGGP